MEQTRTAFQGHINDTAVEEPIPAAVTEYFIQILDVVCIILSVTCNDYIKIANTIIEPSKKEYNLEYYNCCIDANSFFMFW